MITTLKEKASQLNNCYNSDVGKESDGLFIQIIGTDCVTSHEEVSWPLTLRQEIPNIHIFNLAY
jgi:hypothetical protein